MLEAGNRVLLYLHLAQCLLIGVDGQRCRRQGHISKARAFGQHAYMQERVV